VATNKSALPEERLFLGYFDEKLLLLVLGTIAVGTLIETTSPPML